VSQVNYDHVTCRYAGAKDAAVEDLSLEIGDGELMVLVGPSGCGKTTSLRTLAGLEPVSAGTLMIGERDVTEVPPKRRDIAMVFQNYALYPHLSELDNIAFPLRIAGVSRGERRARAAETAQLLGLETMADRKPGRLSGGQRQRVAMGRAIVRQPAVFLMDEPLSNLDAQLRVSTRAQISELQDRLKITTVYVTHDQVEAMTMGDRVAVLKDGRLQQVDRPKALYERPVNAFVAGFIGSPAMNMLPATLDSGTLRIGEHCLGAVPGADGRSGAVLAGARPEALRITDEAAGIGGRVTLVEELGSDAYLHLLTELGGDTRTLVARVHDDRTPPARGETVRLSLSADAIHLFDADDGQRIATDRQPGPGTVS
jgi:multiple sugar transport system ATP-binding protein